MIKAPNTEFKASPSKDAETTYIRSMGGFAVYELDTNEGLLW